jgi:hypothetical protein
VARSDNTVNDTNRADRVGEQVDTPVDQPIGQSTTPIDRPRRNAHSEPVLPTAAGRSTTGRRGLRRDGSGGAAVRRSIGASVAGVEVIVDARGVR